MWPMADLREIRVFLILAEELHFGRTGERLGLTASRVGQIIRTLETRLGGRLFDRTSRRVTLTPLGEQLRDRITPAYEQLERAFHDARNAATGIAGTLRIGAYSPMSCGPRWVQIVERFESRHPACRVEFVTISTKANYLLPLRARELELLAVRLPLDQPDITIGPILSQEPRVLLVARHHQLADHDTVCVEDLAEHVVSDVSAFPRELMNAFIPPTTPSGRTLRRIDNLSVEETTMRIATGAQVHPSVPSWLDYHGHPNIVAVPFRDLPPSETALVWLTSNHSPKIQAFARSATHGLDHTDWAGQTTS